MLSNDVLDFSNSIKSELNEYRRYLHRNAEIGFDLKNTVSFVKKKLLDMGCNPHICGKSGITAVIGSQEKGKVFLIRADMDALPIKEESGVDFASVNGAMHACGHDMHTTMLLGAARILKHYENRINGAVKLMFQPSEETLDGALDMINSGVLENPSPKGAMMIHVMTAAPFDSGIAIISSGGISAPGACYFEIDIYGKGCHGSMPDSGIDPINVCAHIIIALQEIQTRELSISENALITIGYVNSGNASNVIPDTAKIGGTFRAYDDSTLKYIKTRIAEISEGVALIFKATASVTFTSECPTLINDVNLSSKAVKYAKELLGDENAFSTDKIKENLPASENYKSSGSEDFAYVSHKVPSVMVALASGSCKAGYTFNLHHPKVRFDETVLPVGSALYAYIAMRWLEEETSD